LKFTQIISEKNSGFLPFSTDDNKLQFFTFDVQEENLASFISTSFYLSFPITDEAKYCRRTSAELNYVENNNYFILDIDNIENTAQFKKVVDYFLFNNYPVLLTQSRSFNNSTNFNIKGVFKLDKMYDLKTIKTFVNRIYMELKPYCSIDLHILNSTSFQAPTRKKERFVIVDTLKTCNAMPIPLEFEEKISEIKYLDVSDNEKSWCINKFMEMGFYQTKQFKSSNTCIQFAHDSEKKSKNGYFLFVDSPFIMHHHDKTKSINIFSEFSKTLFGKTILRENHRNNLLNMLKKNTAHNSLHSIEQQYLSLDEKTKDYVKFFVENKKTVLKVKSFMGSGKSTVIDYTISTSLKQGKRVLVLSNRINSAIEYAGRYNMKTYYDDTYIPGDSIIVQMESLWKYDIRNFDIFIIDEFCSVLFQTISGLSQKQRINIKKFFSIFENALNVILVDAFLLGFEEKFINKYEKIFKIENTEKDCTTVKIFAEKTPENDFVDLILNSTEKISVSSTSKSFALNLKNLLEEKGKIVLLVTGDLPAEHKKDVLKLIGSEKQKLHWDVLIYSPTITVGVNILNMYKTHYHYDCSASCDVISSIQMLKRVRNAKNIVVFLKQSAFKNLILSDDDLLRQYKTELQALDFEEFDDFGNIVVSKEQEFVCKIRTVMNLLENNHKLSFEVLLHEQFKDICYFESTALSKNTFKKKKVKQEYVMSKIEHEKNCFNGVLGFAEEERIEKELHAIHLKFINYFNFDTDTLFGMYLENITNKNFINKLHNLYVFTFDTIEQISEKIALLVLNRSFSSDENVTKKFLLNCLTLKDDLVLQSWFAVKDLNKDKIRFLQSIGYVINNKRLELPNLYTRGLL